MFYHEVTTIIIIIGTGYHFKYDVILAGSKQEAMDAVKPRYASDIIDGQTAEKCGIPLQR
jgi:hypothetical protein